MAMELSRIEKVCRFYLHTLNKDYIREVGCNRGDRSAATRYLRTDYLDRLIAMIRNEPERREKIMRWYGFAQGVLVGANFFTVDQVKDHSNPDVPPPECV